MAYLVKMTKGHGHRGMGAGSQPVSARFSDLEIDKLNRHCEQIKTPRSMLIHKIIMDHINATAE